ncbi:MAG: ribose 5-phosphate isomerase B [Alphaproteobacteria bacterium]|nr:MAG: ribose 5-phosphate isomerase B [Alphaproteobacteria bacterium]
MNEILIASDHAGFKLKKILIEELQGEIKFDDLGPFSEDSVDYPDYARKLSKKIDLKKDLLGVLICGSGIGMSMVANRFKNVRAALCMNNKMSMLARQHNNANILVLGSRLISEQEAIKCLLVFLKTNYEGGRHQARLDKFNLVE